MDNIILVHICINTKVTFNNHNKILRRYPYLTSYIYVPSKVFDFILIENLGIYHESRPKGITFGGN